MAESKVNSVTLLMCHFSLYDPFRSRTFATKSCVTVFMSNFIRRIAYNLVLRG